MWPKRLSGLGLAAVHLVGFAFHVVGEHDIDLAGLRIGLDVFRAIHLGGAEEVGGTPCLDDHVGLGAEPVLRRQGALSEDQRHPGAASVGIEPGDVERAGIQDIAVGLPVG